MACSCCSTGCKCTIPGGSDPSGTTPNPNQTYDFSYLGSYSPGPWINRKYPVPFHQAVYNRYAGVRLAPNAVVLDDGQILYYGDLQYQIGFSRSGAAASYHTGIFTYQVPDWDGDGSASFKPGWVESDRIPISYTIFDLKEIQDTDKRECQLWVRYWKQIPRYYDEINNRNIYYEFTDPSEPELLHSTKWNEPAPQQVIITLPGSKFSNIDNVEIRFYCRELCYLFNRYEPYLDPSYDPKTLYWIATMTGQPSYISKSTIEFNELGQVLDYCESYGSYNGTHISKALNCEDYPWIRSYTTNSIAELIVLQTAYCFAGNGFGAMFFAYGYCCERANGPCNPIPGYYNGHIECCDNLVATYQTLEDGTIYCSCGGFNAWADFGSDPYTVNIISSKNFILDIGWRYNVENYTSSYDCKKAVAGQGRFANEGDETFIYTAGTLTINGV